MSHSVNVVLIADQTIKILGKEINIHDIETICLDSNGKINSFSIIKKERQVFILKDNKYPRKFRRWMKSGNVVKTGENEYLEQTTQYKKKFTLEELFNFYKKEYGTHS